MQRPLPPAGHAAHLSKTLGCHAEAIPQHSTLWLLLPTAHQLDLLERICRRHPLQAIPAAAAGLSHQGIHFQARHAACVKGSDCSVGLVEASSKRLAAVLGGLIHAGAQPGGRATGMGSGGMAG